MKVNPRLCWIGLLSVIAIVFIMIGHVYREQIQLRLKQQIFSLPACKVDYWALSHSILFFLFGMIMPRNHVKFFAMGILWELLEDFLSASGSTQLVDCAKQKCNWWCNGLEDGYWYASVWDPVFNLIGYTAGSALVS